MGFAQFTEVYAYGFRGRKLESIGVSPVCKFIETLLEMTFYNMDMLRSVADQNGFKISNFAAFASVYEYMSIIFKCLCL